MNADDLMLVSVCLDRDIRTADAGESVDVLGIVADLNTFRVAEVKAILSGLSDPIRATGSKREMIQRVCNRLTARERAETRNYC